VRGNYSLRKVCTAQVSGLPAKVKYSAGTFLALLEGINDSAVALPWNQTTTK